MSIGIYTEFNKNNISSVSDYWCLLKPKIMYLVVFTACAGIIAAPGSINYVIAIVTIICVALGSGAAGAINMWYDSDIDALMSRTKTRPIPAGRVMKGDVLEFGLVLATISISVMAIVVNYIASFLLAVSILIYVLIYTIFLKRKTPYNIVIGGAAGALPPVIGWVSVTGSISFESIVFFAIIFMWTPPHFWALSLLNCSEYEKVKVPMMPVVYGIKRTKINIFVYSIIMVITTMFPGFFIKNRLMYEISALVMGGVFILYATLVLVRENELYYRKLFSYSILYLFLLFFAIMIFSYF